MFANSLRHIYFIAMVTALAPLLAGCFDLSQNLSVKSDGSGRLQTTFGLDRRFAGMSGAGMSPLFCENNPDGGGIFDDDENIRQTTLGYREAGGYAYCDLTLNFKDITALAPGDILRKRLLPGPWVPGRQKFLEVRKLKGGIIQLRQDFHLGGDEMSMAKTMRTPGGPERTLFKRMFGEKLADRRLRVTFRAPRILSTNGAKSKDGQTVFWSRPMLDLFDASERHNNILIIEFKIGKGVKGT